MRASNNSKSKNSTDNHRSYFDWGRNMQVIRKGNGDIAMTESELVRFFDVSWRKLNYRLQTIIKSSNFHPNERGAGEEEIIKRGKTVSYLPLYPLPTIIALSFLLDSMEVHLFREYICERLQKPASVITPIFLLGNTNN
jgi:hypothetical protein